MSKVENCANCGGTHYGSVDCPYLEKNMGEPCKVCEERTSYCCADCRIDGKGKVYVCTSDTCRNVHERDHSARRAEHISPWPEQRPPRTEAQRSAFAKEQSAHLPIPDRDGTLVSDFDLAAMRAAFAKRFNEQLPRTETLMAVAHIGYRMCLRDIANK